MIKKIFFLLLFNGLYNNKCNCNCFRFNDNFLIYIIDNDLQNITNKNYMPYKSEQKYDFFINNVYNYLIKLILIPSKNNKDKKIKRIRNTTKKKRRDENLKIIINKHN